MLSLPFDLQGAVQERYVRSWRSGFRPVQGARSIDKSESLECLTRLSLPWACALFCPVLVVFGPSPFGVVVFWVSFSLKVPLFSFWVLIAIADRDTGLHTKSLGKDKLVLTILISTRKEQELPPNCHLALPFSFFIFAYVEISHFTKFLYVPILPVTEIRIRDPSLIDPLDGYETLLNSLSFAGKKTRWE